MERLADNINRSLYLEVHNVHHQAETRETHADISPSSEEREAQDPDPGSRENSLEEFLNTVSKYYSLNRSSFKALLNWTNKAKDLSTFV